MVKKPWSYSTRHLTTLAPPLIVEYIDSTSFMGIVITAFVSKKTLWKRLLLSVDSTNEHSIHLCKAVQNGWEKTWVVGKRREESLIFSAYKIVDELCGCKFCRFSLYLYLGKKF